MRRDVQFVPADYGSDADLGDDVAELPGVGAELTEDDALSYVDPSDDDNGYDDENLDVFDDPDDSDSSSGSVFGRQMDGELLRTRNGIPCGERHVVQCHQRVVVRKVQGRDRDVRDAGGGHRRGCA